MLRRLARRLLLPSSSDSKSEEIDPDSNRSGGGDAEFDRKVDKEVDVVVDLVALPLLLPRMGDGWATVA